MAAQSVRQTGEYQAGAGTCHEALQLHKHSNWEVVIQRPELKWPYLFSKGDLMMVQGLGKGVNRQQVID